MGRPSMEVAKRTGVLTINNAIKITGLTRSTIMSLLNGSFVDGAFQIPNTKEWRMPAPGLVNALLRNSMPVKNELVELQEVYNAQHAV